MNQPRKVTFSQWCRRYISFSLVVVIGVLVYIMFFTSNSLPDTYKYQREADQLTHQIKMENDSLQYYRQLNISLTSDPKTLERLAREKYHMQRPDEDVFIFVDDSK